MRADVKHKSREVKPGENPGSPQGRNTAGQSLVVIAVSAAVIAGVHLPVPIIYLGLLLFAAILLAVLLDAVVGFLHRRTGIARIPALIVTAVAFVAVGGLAFLLTGPRIIEQAFQLFRRMPEAAARVKSYLLTFSWGGTLWQRLTQMQFAAGSLVERVGTAFSSTLGVVGNVLIVLFVGFFIAVRPEVYREGALRLIPPRRRERIRDVLRKIGSGLRLWLLARLVSMAAVGILSLVGYLAIGVQPAPALALIAGALSFIPYLGPVLGVVPALIVALAQEPIKAVYVLVVYTAIQVLESYLITPLIEQQTTSVPAALLITVQIIMALAGGILGILVATPLAVVGMVAIRMLYIEDALHDRLQ